ncbi:hypothetical protein DPEC_G00332130 [Dallia pectoralis]|uniref:Uncharacterized protein n=1 Tax=Dallia pectoralis TaxID=75939 RepID=A0ACC2F666_DALPE|nr:hypothetical protein DPEC_G00332130 [Dallia pectoralis]
MSTTRGRGQSKQDSAKEKILAELEKMKKDNQDGHTQTQLSLIRLETSFADLKGELTELQKRTTEAEDRIGANEDTTGRHERALHYLLHREMDLNARCEDMQNRLRRNNLRIFKVAEGSEGRDVKLFVHDLLKSVLRLPHDFSPELQKKRALVREAVKQLKMKNIRAKCVFPAQLRVFVEDGTKTYPTLTDAKLVLELGVHARVDERERLETELCRGRWNAATLAYAEIKAFFNTDN